VVERLVAWYRITSSVGAVVALVAANAIPLLGVLFLGWNVWTILIIYWLENGIVGVYNVLKMARAEGTATPDAGRVTMNGRPIDGAAKAALIPFFVLHYGIFWTVHGVFVLTFPLFAGIGDVAGSPGVLEPGFPDLPLDPGLLPSDDRAPDMTAGFSLATVLFAAVALVISHGVSFWLDFLGRGEYRRVSAAGQMFAPYGRLVVLHLTIIVGGIAITILGAPAAAVAILVGLKTVADLALHLAEHRRAAPTSAEAERPSPIADAPAR
jgi:hypothetical protein